MAPGTGSDDDDTCYKNDAALSLPLPLAEEETTTTKRQRFTASVDKCPANLTAPSLPFSSSSSASSSHHPPMPEDGDAPHGPPPLPSLPLELIVEILSRLPVKFLLQLRCVCNSWNSFISDPQFAKKHLRVSSLGTQFTRQHLLLSFMNRTPEFILTAYSLHSIFNSLTTSARRLDYPLRNRNRFDLIVGSCDGLLCFAINQSCALLWNPSIRKFKKLPSLENERRQGSYTIYGFGFDHSTDSYKVVAIFCYEYESNNTSAYKTEVKVHTLGTKYWRRIQEFPSGVPFDESGKFVSGTLNWLATTASRSPWVIISLDLGKESYQELSQPDYGEVVVFTLTLGVLRDCLCILSHSNTFSDVWVMKDYGIKESWIKLFSVPYLGSPDSYPYTKALCISEDGKILLEFQSKLVLYNSRNATFEFPEIENVNGWIVAEVYIESLITPCS